MKRILDFTKETIQDILREGDLAIDATAGNGHDTAFLAQCVGPRGHVYGFDVQPQAIENTNQRLKDHNLHDQVTLFLAGHETMADYIPSDQQGNITAIMFNLGYLPGADHSLITTERTTLQALEHSLNLLKPGGRTTVVIYPGHPGGQHESSTVLNWAQNLDPNIYQAIRYDNLNPKSPSPFLLAIEKRR